MKKYLSVFRIRLINGMQYRAAVWSAVVTRLGWIMMEILAYTALYRSNAALPMAFSQLVSYIWMEQVLFILFKVVFADGEIYTAISSGSIAYELVRPMSLYGRWFSQSAANRVAFTVVNHLPVILVGLLVPAPFKMALPSLGQTLLFLLSSVLALGVVVAFAMLMYVSLFYIVSQRGVKIIVTALTAFLSGGVVPLVFFPEPVLRIVRLLPFAAMQNMPLMIFSGNIAGAEALRGILFQLFWLTALFLIGQLSMRGSLKRVIVQGG